MSKKKHKKIDWRQAAEALAKAERAPTPSRPVPSAPTEIEKEIEVKPQEKVTSTEKLQTTPQALPDEGPDVKREIKKISWVAGLLVLVLAGTIVLDRTTSLPSVLAGKMMVFLHLE